MSCGRLAGKTFFRSPVTLFPPFLIALGEQSRLQTNLFTCTLLLSPLGFDRAAQLLMNFMGFIFEERRQKGDTTTRSELTEDEEPETAFP